MKKFDLIVLFCLLAVVAQAQEKCGMQMLIESNIARHPQFAAEFQQRLDAQRAQVAAYKQAIDAGTLQKTTSVSAVPIIFHIVLDSAQIAQLGGERGIHERVDSQIAVLNRDYNGANSDAYLIPAAFQPLYGNVGIKFAPAGRTPSGAFCPGYEIKVATVHGFDMTVNGPLMDFNDAKFDSTGGTSIWDPSTYLNVWVISPSGAYANVIGYTIPKSLTGGSSGYAPSQEGVTLNYGAFGVKSRNISYFINSSAQGGRTLTHETGHFFEIWHPSGDDDGHCPGDPGGKDDGISDTPPEGYNHQGSYPTMPIVTDNCSPTAPGVMYMNFMDYPDDPYALLFTQDQATHMQAMVAPGGESYSLTQHPNAVSISNVAAIGHVLNIFPNPTAGLLHIAPGDQDIKNITIINTLGQTVKTIIPSAKAGIYTIDMAGMQKGLYFVQCYFKDGMTSGKIVLQ